MPHSRFRCLHSLIGGLSPTSASTHNTSSTDSRLRHTSTSPLRNYSIGLFLLRIYTFLHPRFCFSFGYSLYRRKYNIFLHFVNIFSKINLPNLSYPYFFFCTPFLFTDTIFPTSSYVYVSFPSV